MRIRWRKVNDTWPHPSEGERLFWARGHAVDPEMETLALGNTLRLLGCREAAGPIEQPLPALPEIDLPPGWDVAIDEEAEGISGQWFVNVESRNSEGRVMVVAQQRSREEAVRLVRRAAYAMSIDFSGLQTTGNTRGDSNRKRGTWSEGLINRSGDHSISIETAKRWAGREVEGVRPELKGGYQPSEEGGQDPPSGGSCASDDRRTRD